MCTLAVYDIKDSVSTCKHCKACVGNYVQEKSRWIHPKIGIPCVLFLMGSFQLSIKPCHARERRVGVWALTKGIHIAQNWGKMGPMIKNIAKNREK